MERYLYNDSIVVQTGNDWPKMSKYARKNFNPRIFKGEKDARKNLLINGTASSISERTGS